MSKDPMRSYSVTVTLTPRQAVEAERALARAAFGMGSGRLFSAASRINSGLYAAGWDRDDKGNWTLGRTTQAGADVKGGETWGT